MKKIVSSINEDYVQPPLPPVATLEARENQMISLAMEVAEERLRNRTATAQEICHWLDLGSTREKLKQELSNEQKELMIAKREALDAARHSEELYAAAIEAMKTYKGDY